MNIKPMLNAYPDSMGGTMASIVEIMEKHNFQKMFQSFYILPSMFNTDLDRGFSVINYDLNERMVKQEDIEALKELNIDLKLDFILNHASVLSDEFQDIIQNGEKSKYLDFFIRWNEFWKDCGEMNGDGFIEPRQELIKDMFFRKPGLPILMVRMPDGKEVPYWNTFYQEVQYKNLDIQDIMKKLKVQYCTAADLTKLVNEQLEKGVLPKNMEYDDMAFYKEQVSLILEENRTYLGQMDLNIKSSLVWEFYKNTLKTLANYGASIVRLDAFAYAPKEPGLKNFMNEPDTWNVLSDVNDLARKYGLTLLPEIHSTYGEKTYDVLCDKGYMTYDFFLPGLIIDAIEGKNGDTLRKWGKEILEKELKVVNMLGCHDGIPLLDLKGMIPDERIQNLIDTVVSRGGYVKNLHGQKNMYYQVNATYYSALGDDDKKMLFARALQLFMPGKPQVWYLDLLAGKNDHKAVELAGPAGHKEINRTNLSMEEIEERFKLDVVKKQVELLNLRNSHEAFHEEAVINIEGGGATLTITWTYEGSCVKLDADFENYEFTITE